MQLIVFARMRAQVVLPTPRGPWPVDHGVAEPDTTAIIQVASALQHRAGRSSQGVSVVQASDAACEVGLQHS